MSKGRQEEKSKAVQGNAESGLEDMVLSSGQTSHNAVTSHAMQLGVAI